MTEPADRCTCGPDGIAPGCELHGHLVALDRERGELIADLVRDYDRRRSTRWGRFLLWLLRKTT